MEKYYIFFLKVYLNKTMLCYVMLQVFCFLYFHWYTTLSHQAGDDCPVYSISSQPFSPTSRFPRSTYCIKNMWRTTCKFCPFLNSRVEAVYFVFKENRKSMFRLNRFYLNIYTQQIININQCNIQTVTSCLCGVMLKAETSPGKKDLSPAILKRGINVMDGATVGGGQPNIW